MDSNEITIEQMAATLAHEVKNPISLVMACIDLLELEDSEGKSRKSYGIMRRELSKVMDMMLDFIQLTKPMETRGCEINVYKLLNAILFDCREFYRNKADFEITAEEQDLRIIGDESKLRRVFFNLYKNSIEATIDKGRVTTAISRYGGFVKILVEDNGIGMTEDILQRISSPFFTTKDNGSGLGVFICKNIIAEHGGSFEIYGEYAKGCTVTIMLPLIG